MRLYFIRIYWLYTHIHLYSNNIRVYSIEILIYVLVCLVLKIVVLNWFKTNMADNYNGNGDRDRFLQRIKETIDDCFWLGTTDTLQKDIFDNIHER